MSNTVLGRNVIVGLFVEGEGYIPIFCAKSMSLGKAFDEIESTTVDSPNAREFEAGLMNAVLTLSGVTTTGIVTNNPLSPFYLNQLADQRSKNDYRVLFTDQSSSQIALEFEGIIRELGWSKETLQWSQTSVTIRVSGAITQTTTIEPPGAAEFNYLSDSWNVIAGLSYVDVGGIASNRDGYNLTATDVVLVVGRSGTPHNIVTGTPGNLETRWNTTLTHQEFDSTNPLNPGETVFILFKRPV